MVGRPNRMRFTLEPRAQVGIGRQRAGKNLPSQSVIHDPRLAIDDDADRSFVSGK
jgi:hypothetical protein